MRQENFCIFGGEKTWSSADWIASDDRVRGGSSRSFMECLTFNLSARFHGELDITSLGGAGFASQRTSGDGRSWDLSGYDGIKIEISKADAKRYTFIVKDAILPRNPENGREQSTTSYEYDFQLSEKQLSSGTHTIYIEWKSLEATYRGRKQKNADPVNLKCIRRFSIMARSFFGNQEGPFSLSIRSISAVKSTDLSSSLHARNDPERQGSNNQSRYSVLKSVKLMPLIGVSMLLLYAGILAFRKPVILAWKRDVTWFGHK